MNEEKRELVVNDRRHVAADVPTIIGATPMEMFADAIRRGVSVETLDRIMDLKERYEKDIAKKAFIAAMTEARKEFTKIVKKHDGYKSRYKYAKLNEFIEAVAPSLSRFGFTYEFEIEPLDNGKVRVTSVITHEGGYEKRNSLDGDPEKVASPDANMNAFQRVGGAVTYLQRITFSANLGLAAGDDNDAGGAIASTGADPNEEASPLLDMIDKARTDGTLKAVKTTIESEAKTRNISPQAFGLVKAHYADVLRKEAERTAANV